MSVARHTNAQCGHFDQTVPPVTRCGDRELIVRRRYCTCILLSQAAAAEGLPITA